MAVNFNSFELITKYLPQAVDKYFVAEAKTAVLEQGSKFIDVNFKETGYVKIASFLMDGLSDYFRANSSESGSYPNYADYAGNVATGYRDGLAIGNVSVNWEIFKLQWCRGKQFKIDYIENEETAGIIMGNMVEEFNKLKVIPEVDACRFSVLADKCSTSLGNLKVEDLSDNDTIIKDFNDAFEWLTENEVPEEEQVMFVSPTVMTYLRNTEELTKFLTPGDYTNANGVNFTLQKYMGRPIIEVPSSRFFTNILVTDNGYRPVASTSKVINYMIVSKKAVVPIRKIEWSKSYGPDQAGILGFYGYIFNYLLYHGVVVPQNKVIGVYTSVRSTADATSKCATLRVDTRPGTVSKHWYLNAYFTNPSALRGYIVYKTTAFTLGGKIEDVGTAGSNYYICDVKQDIDESSAVSDVEYYFALVDSLGNIIATSDKVKVVDL